LKKKPKAKVKAKAKAKGSQPAMQTTITQYVKAGLQGGAGSGKSTTAALLLLALSREYHNRAPVLVFDTEPGWQFVKPMFDAEGVPLLLVHGRHFKGMHDALKRAISEGCCGFVVDSITHPWQELLERFADSTGRVPFHKFNQIKPLWNEWTTDFLNAPLHAVANGRLAFDYFYEEAEDGRKELVKGDAKMKAGGGESFGYEPHLLCEMSHERVRGRNGKLKGLQYRCLVLKDRSRALNGKEFAFADFGAYQPNGYQAVLKVFRAHIEALTAIGAATLPKATSAVLVPEGNSVWSAEQRQKTIVLEEIEATLGTKLWPGNTNEAKQNKLRVIEELFGTRSWTKVETFPLVELERGLVVLLDLEKRLETETPSDAKMLVEMIRMAARAVRQQVSAVRCDEHLEAGKTALESMLQQSVENVHAARKLPGNVAELLEQQRQRRAGAR
jgi:hypothetical protein